MTTKWGDYCGASYAYEVEYVSGPFNPAPSREQIDAVFTGSPGSTTFNVKASDNAWSGTHSIRIRGISSSTAGVVYSSVVSPTISIEMGSACRFTELDQTLAVTDMIWSI